MRFLARSSIVLAVALAAPRAFAGEAEETEALLARGVELREQGKDDEALAHFKRALARSPSSARARAQVALAEQALGMWVAAEADLEGALASKDDAWIAKNRAALEGALGVIRRHVGSLEVRGDDGAEVVLDGVVLGKLPQAAPLRAEAGRRTLEVRKRGFHAASRAVEIAPGAVARETVTLVALPPDAPAARGASGAAGHDEDRGRGQRLLGWVFTGTGGAFVGAGAVSLLVRKGIVDDYNEQCPGLGSAQPADCDAKIDSARTWLTVSIVSFVGGGVLAAGGLALVLTAPRGEPRSASGPGTRAVGWSAWCAPGLGSVACAATF